MNWRDSLDAPKARLLTIQSSTEIATASKVSRLWAPAVFAVVTLLR
ncbi:MAG: hypothetical protein CM15mP25_3420 [Gammaproteobacteria bacterium]|nr:MAG: hypothetical protein CM15mP25_3420 [Gammaproteobacteria bacterium]